MKEKEEGIRSIPEGIWESSRPKREGKAGSVESGNVGVTGAQNKTADPRGEGLFNAVDSPADPSLTMDWQGNGYPGQPKSRTESDNS